MTSPSSSATINIYFPGDNGCTKEVRTGEDFFTGEENPPHNTYAGVIGKCNIVGKALIFSNGRETIIINRRFLTSVHVKV